jgi:EAL domain-containing protein (putative c-di-GMP-specific phosphodiesterase class I)
LTDGVFRKSFTAWHDWCRAGLRLRLALNVSPILLRTEDWYNSFLVRCSEFSIDPKWITLEITETAAGATDAQASEILHKLQKKGFSLSIDDFGTGFSSLATLYKLPISEMKIDKSFILDLQSKTGARDLVETAVAMAKRLGIKVVAEGVETEGLFRELCRIGCDEAQGYFIGKSMPADAIVPFFTSWSRPEGLTIPQTGQKLPKIAVAQALLNELANDLAAPQRVQTNTYAGSKASQDNGTHPKSLIEKLPALILGGKTIAALANCHAALRKLSTMSCGDQVIAKLKQVQAHLEDELLCTSELEIKTAYETIRLLPRESVMLGRPLATTRGGVGVKCRWLGPVDKNLRIFRKYDEYFIEDLGGNNGHRINGVRLRAKHPVEIEFGRTTVEICLASGAIAPLWIQLQRKSSDPDAIAINFGCDKQPLRADLSEKEWLEIKEQLGLTWILFPETINIGRSQDCAAVLSDCTVPTAAKITFEGGLRIEPADDASLEVDEHRFDQRLPLISGSELCLGGSRFTTRSVIDDSTDSQVQFRTRNLMATLSSQ